MLKYYTKLKQKVSYPPVKFKVIFAGVFEGTEEERLHTASGDRNSGQILSKPGVNGVKKLPDASDRKQGVFPAPHKETVLAEITISSQDIFAQASFSQYEEITLASQWHIGGQSGPMELVIACKVSREVSLWPLSTFSELLLNSRRCSLLSKVAREIV